MRAACLNKQKSPPCGELFKEALASKDEGLRPPFDQST